MVIENAAARMTGENDGVKVESGDVAAQSACAERMASVVDRLSRKSE